MLPWLDLANKKEGLRSSEAFLEVDYEVLEKAHFQYPTKVELSWVRDMYRYGTREIFEEMSVHIKVVQRLCAWSEG